MNEPVTCQSGLQGPEGGPAAAATLLEEDDYRKRGGGYDEHQPFHIVAPEPAGEVENEDDDRDNVEAVKDNVL